MNIRSDDARIEYRPAHPADAAAIAECQIAMAWETERVALDRDTCAAGVRAVFDSPDKGRYFVAVAEAEAIAATLLVTYEWSDWRNGVVWWLQSVYVQPSYRRRGVFRGFYDYILRHLDADASIRGLRLYVDTRNAAAQSVYRQLGMVGDHYTVFERMKDP
jgi:GNAT superfamily N-acetyltransferase